MNNVLKIPSGVKVWLISDTHFNHANVIRYSHRPFVDIPEMNATMVSRWQALVSPEDVVFHLGDMFMGAWVEAEPILKQLPGRKHLILGNHDGMIRKQAVLQAYFEGIHEILEVKHVGATAVLCHFPLRSWNGMHYNVWNLHGHCHGTLAPIGKQLDVGVDAVGGYEPVSWSWVAEYMAGRAFERTDHHGA